MPWIEAKANIKRFLSSERERKIRYKHDGNNNNTLLIAYVVCPASKSTYEVEVEML